MTGVLIGACGALGAVLRFLVDTGLRRVWPTRFPVATVAINISGSLVLGAVTAATLDHAEVVRLAVGVGFCGGYTTFSTAMVETVRLARERRAVLTMASLLGQPLGCVLAAAAGYAVVVAG